MAILKRKKVTEDKPIPILKRLIKFLKPYNYLLLLSILSSLILALTNIASAFGMKGMADSTIAHSLKPAMAYFYFLIFIVLIEAPIQMLKTYVSGKYAEKSLFKIRQETAERIQKLPVPYIDNHSAGDFLSRITNDTNLIQGFLQGSLADLIIQPLYFITAVIFLIYTSWKLAVFSLVLLPLLMYISVIISKPTEKYTKEQQEALSEVNSLAQDSLSGLSIIKSFTSEKDMFQKFDKEVNNSVAKGLKLSIIQAIMNPIGIFTSFVPFLMTFAYGGYLVVNKDLSFGGLLSFIQILNYVANPIQYMPRLLSSVRSTIAAIKRIFEIWDEKPERHDGSDLPITSDEVIRFNNVKFGYNETNLFNSLNFNIKKGETVALVGPSGAGKSTVLKLLTGFYEPQEGSISIFGHDIKEWNPDAMRKYISIVSQDTYLFPESIYNNISYGKENATEAEVYNTSKMAGLSEFIESLPDKYDTLVGERGVKLSGGQKQRVSIARAILKNAPILLLDEATSALDTESEKYVQDALDNLMTDRTTLVIAHRLSTIKNATRILVMNEGKIVESGTHDELFAVDGLYKQLYLKQYMTASEDSDNDFVNA